MSKHAAGRIRGDETRERIVAAAVEVFGQMGFEGASTRILAAAAGANIQAIQYHFGGKEGLYLAVASHIAAMMRSGLEAGTGQAQRELAEGIESGRARELLAGLLGRGAALVTSGEAAVWSRFVLREQMAPTAAFERLYQDAMAPTLLTVRRLLAVILRQQPDSQELRLRAMTLMGQALIFRAAHATAIRELGWTEIGPVQLQAITDVIAQTVAALPGPGQLEPSR